jgi:peptidoglycan/LPS O-acetylase OafA/YrhL
MLVRGWAPGDSSQSGGWWSRMLLWIFPVTDPPHLGSDWSLQVSSPLWYIRTYLWFVLLSPLLLRAFRRAPWASIAAFLGLAAVFQYSLVPAPDPLLTAMTDVATFGACWLLGFAHREGRLDALTARTTCAAAAVLLAAGAWFAYTHPTGEGLDLGEIPLAQALWSLGFVLLLLRFRPRRPLRLGAAAGPVHLLNSRAVTVYLWHEIALVLTVPLIDLMWKVPAFEMSLPLDAVWFQYLVVWPLIGAAIVLFGWAEDLAARRRPRLWPWRG